MLKKKFVDEEGEMKPMFLIAYSKSKKGFFIKSVEAEKDYSYISYIFRINIKRARQLKKILKKIREENNTVT